MVAAMQPAPRTQVAQRAAHTPRAKQKARRAKRSAQSTARKAQRAKRSAQSAARKACGRTWLANASATARQPSAQSVATTTRFIERSRRVTFVLGGFVLIVCFRVVCVCVCVCVWCLRVWRLLVCFVLSRPAFACCSDSPSKSGRQWHHKAGQPATASGRQTAHLARRRQHVAHDLCVGPRERDGADDPVGLAQLGAPVG